MKLDIVIRNWKEGCEIGDSSFLVIIPALSSKAVLATWTPAEGYRMDARPFIMRDTHANTIFSGEELTGYLERLREYYLQSGMEMEFNIRKRIRSRF